MEIPRETITKFFGKEVPETFKFVREDGKIKLLASEEEIFKFNSECSKTVKMFRYYYGQEIMQIYLIHRYKDNKHFCLPNLTDRTRKLFLEECPHNIIHLDDVTDDELLTVLLKHPKCIKYLTYIKHDIFKKVVEKFPKVIKYINIVQKDDFFPLSSCENYDIYMSAIQKDPMLLKYVYNGHLTKNQYDEIAKTAIKLNEKSAIYCVCIDLEISLFSEISPDIKEKIKIYKLNFIEKVTKEHPDLLKYMELKNSYHVINLLIKNAPNQITHIENFNQISLTKQKELVENSKFDFRKIPRVYEWNMHPKIQEAILEKDITILEEWEWVIPRDLQKRIIKKLSIWEVEENYTYNFDFDIYYEEKLKNMSVKIEEKEENEEKLEKIEKMLKDLLEKNKNFDEKCNNIRQLLGNIINQSDEE